MWEVFSTNGVAPHARATHWSRGYTDRFAAVRVDPEDPRGFNAELKVGDLGPVSFACIRSTPTQVERSKTSAASVSQRMFGFIMQLSGAGSVDHCGREARIEPGGVVLNDNTEPLRCRYAEPMESITVRTSEAAILSRLPFVNEVRGVCLPARIPLLESGIDMARSLTTRCGNSVPADYEATLGGFLLDIIAMSYSIAKGRSAPPETVSGSRQALVMSFIERHLQDPELTPATISDALHISSRYLRKLMEHQGECASSYILRRRLEECAKRLTSSLSQRQTVTEIAFSHGFNSTAHFARVFKARYGVTPSEFRMMGIAPQELCRSQDRVLEN